MKKSVYKRKKAEQRGIAEERISILLGMAKDCALEKDFLYANRYVRLAVNIAKKYNIRLKEKKRLFCRKCLFFFLPSVTSKTRINSDKMRVEVTCLNCGYTAFYPYSGLQKRSTEK